MVRLAHVVVGSVALGTVALAGGVLVAACASFSDADTPGELATDAAATNDGAANDDAPSGVIGPSDDAGIDSDATADGWTLLFTEDFSNGLSAWTALATTGTAQITVGSGELVTKTGTTAGIAYIGRQPTSALSYGELRVDFRVRPETLGAPVPCIASLQPASNERPSLRLQLAPSQAVVNPVQPALRHELTQAGSFQDHPFDGQIPTGQWTKVRIEVRVGAASRVRILYNDVLVLDVALTEAFPPLPRPYLGIGLTCEQALSDVHFDDVSVYTR